MAQDKGLYNLLIDLRANVSTLQSDMNKAVGILERSGRTMSGVVQGIFQGVGQALGREVLGSISRISTALTDLANKGDRAGGILDNFQKLGGSASSIEQAKKAILGTVDAFELMRVANEGLAKGIPNLNQNFARLAEFSNRFADATGQDTLPVLNQLIDAIGTGAPKALKAFGFELQDGTTKAQAQAAVYEQLLGKMERLAPLGVSVTQSQERLNAVMTEAISMIGIGINENEGLAKSWEELAQQIERIDWREVGDGIGYVAEKISVVTSAVISALNPLVNLILNLKTVMQIGDMVELSAERARLKAMQALNVRSPQVMAADAIGVDFMGSKEGREQWQQRENELQAKIREIDAKIAMGVINQAASSFIAKGPSTGGPLGVQGTTGGSLTPSPGGNGGGSNTLDKLRADWAKFTEQDVRKGLGDAIRNIDTTSFLPLKEKLKSDLETSFLEANKKFVDAKLISLDELNIRAKDYAAEEVAEYQQKMDEAIRSRFSTERKNAEELAEIQIRAAEESARMHRDAVNSWQAFYDRAFSGQGIDPTESLKELASGFLSELSASFFGELKGNAGTFVGLGQLIAAGFNQGLSGIFGSTGGMAGGSSGGGLGGIMDTVGGLFSGGMSTETAHAAGIQGPGLANGSFGGGLGWGAAGVGTLVQIGTSAFAAKDTDKRNKDNSGTGAAVGTAAGAGVGAVFGPLGMMIGSQIGQVAGTIIGSMIKWGPQNKETQARHSFANWMEDRLQGMNGLTVLDRNNANPRTLTNFMEGSSKRFNREGWADDFNRQAGKTASTFGGLGTALKELLGITEDVASQFAAMLGENLNFNINNARHLVKRLGLTFEELQEKLVELGRQGKKTWLEIESDIQGVSEAFKPGLAEQGAVDKAFDNVINSGARGFFAIQSLRDIAEEAIEANIKDLDQLREHLLKTYDPELVDKFFQALDRRGIKSIEQLRTLNDRDAGGVIAEMQALGVQFKESSKEMGEGVDNLGEVTKTAGEYVKEATSALRDLTKQLGGKNVQKSASMSPTDEDVDAAYATGGIVSRPTKALMGEAGPEAILPLSRKNGRLGVQVTGDYGSASGMVIHIDARGATPGVEGRIRSAMKEAEDRAVRRMARSLQSSARM